MDTVSGLSIATVRRGDDGGFIIDGATTEMGARAALEGDLVGKLATGGCLTANNLSIGLAKLGPAMKSKKKNINILKEYQCWEGPQRLMKATYFGTGRGPVRPVPAWLAATRHRTLRANRSMVEKELE